MRDYIGMRILLDQCLPVPMRECLTSHEVATVLQRHQAVSNWRTEPASSSIIQPVFNLAGPMGSKLDEVFRFGVFDSRYRNGIIESGQPAFPMCRESQR